MWEGRMFGIVRPLGICLLLFGEEPVPVSPPSSHVVDPGHLNRPEGHYKGVPDWTKQPGVPFLMVD